MNKKFCIGTLIVCFGFSNINVGWATDVVAVSPVIVQPYDLQALNQQVLERDRQTRDEEIEITGLIADNDKLIQATLAGQQDQGLSKVNQIMLNYRNALLLRDQQRIAANSEQPSHYYDLITLTEDVQNAIGVHQDLEVKRNLIEEKYQILNDLKDEMAALNDKLRGEGGQPKDAIIEGFKKLAQEQQDKIQMLVVRLGEMDQKLAHFDEMLAQKDRQIMQLRDNLARVQGEVSSKDEIIKELSGQQNRTQDIKISENVETAPIIVQPNTGFYQQKHGSIAYGNDREVVQTPAIVVQPVGQNVSKNAEARFIQQQADDLQAKDDTIRWLKEVLAVAKSKAEYFKLMSRQNNVSVEPLQEEVQQVKDDFALRLKDFDKYQSVIISLKDRVSQLSKQLVQKQQQVDLLKNGAMPPDDRLELARQLIDLQQQTQALLIEKSRLTLQKYTVFDGRLAAFENRVKALLAHNRIQAIDWQDKMDTLKNELSQKQQQVDSLKAQLEEKIANQKNQGQLEAQIQDLTTQLQAEQEHMARLKAQIQSSYQEASEIPALREQLVAQRDKIVSLKTELENKTAESDKLTALVGDYQQKLESTNSATNEQMQQLKEKQAEIIVLKQDMSSLQKHIMDRNKDLQSKDLSLFMVQQRMDEKSEDIKALRQELALDQQRLEGMPTSDEVDFLKSGLKKAAVELREKEQEMAQLKAAAGKYPEKLAIQAKTVQNLTEQLQGAQQELSKNQSAQEDKTKEILRLKHLAQMAQQDWNKEAMTLNQKLDAAEKKFSQKMYDRQMMALEVKLKEQIQDNDKMRVRLQSLQGRKTVPKALQSLKEQLQNAQQALSKSKQDLEDKAKEIMRLHYQLGLAEKKSPNKMYDNQMTALEVKLKEQIQDNDQMRAQIRSLQEQTDQQTAGVKAQPQQEPSNVEMTEDMETPNLSINPSMAGALQSLKEQLQNAQQEIVLLNHKLSVAEKKAPNKMYDTQMMALEVKLRDSLEEIKALKAQVNKSKVQPKGDAVREKLAQALNKIQEQGRLINTLSQKLEEVQGQEAPLPQK